VENKENDEHETDDNNDELDDSIFKTQSTFIDINPFSYCLLKPYHPCSIECFPHYAVDQHLNSASLVFYKH
jgi:hypothetical protein